MIVYIIVISMCTSYLQGKEGPFTNVWQQCNFIVQNGSTRIVGGISAQSAEDFPYAVSLQVVHPEDGGYYMHYCGATIIRNRILLTAAHCLWDEQRNLNRRGSQLYEGIINGADKLYAAIGPLCRHQKGKGLFEVERFYIPTQYTGNGIDGSDIAILVLAESGQQQNTTFSNQFPDFETQVTLDGRNDMTVIGWGLIDENDQITYGQTVIPIQVAMLDYENPEECKPELLSMSNNFILDEETQFCAKYSQPGALGTLADTCGGDSGGPILLMDYEPPVIVGITSWGPNLWCSGDLGLPGVYTEVYKHIQWIQEVLTKIQNELGIDVSRVQGSIDQTSQPVQLPQTPTLPPECVLPADAGFGEATKQAYYYDVDFHTCVEFVWEGLGGNANNFITEDDCKEFCIEQPSLNN